MTSYGPGLLVVVAVTAALVWPCRRGTDALAAASASHPHRSLRALLASLVPRSLRVRAGGRGGPDPETLADLLEVVVPALRAGATEAVAVEIAGHAIGADHPRSESLGDPVQGLVDDLTRGARQGQPLAAVWSRAATSQAVPGAGFVARAWTLSQETGVPLSLALATAARSLRAQGAAARALAASTAGARASMLLLALLPAAGPLVGLMFGLTPLDLYGGTRAGTLCLVVGTVLGAAGWLWSRAIVSRALRPSSVASRR